MLSKWVFFYGTGGLQKTVGIKCKKNFAQHLHLQWFNSGIFKDKYITLSCISIKLPDLGSIVTDQPQKVTDNKLKLKEELDSIALRTRNKKIF
jgi:hypothetical protein